MELWWQLAFVIDKCYQFELRQQEVEIKLALGSTPKQASKAIVRDVIKTGLQPTVDSAKTLGIVALPGMMTGLILAGMPPLEAVKYQMIVTFMSLSTISIACFITCQLAYRTFFNNRNQFKIGKLSTLNIFFIVHQIRIFNQT